jgi:hypothetical protein
MLGVLPHGSRPTFGTYNQKRAFRAGPPASLIFIGTSRSPMTLDPLLSVVHCFCSGANCLEQNDIITS